MVGQMTWRGWGGTRVCAHVNTLLGPPVNPRVQDGATALIWSAENGHLDVARLLLDSKADIHAANKVPQFAHNPNTLTLMLASPSVWPAF